MSVATEPELLPVFAAVTTAIAAGTQKTQTIAAAPGATLRFRVYVVTIAFDLTTGVPVAATAITVKVNSGGSSYVLAISYPNHPSASIVIPQGTPFPINQALRLLDASNVANAPYMYGISYVTEVG